MTQQQWTKILVRVPLDVKAWLEDEAARNCSTQTSEIVRSVRARMESEQAQAAG